MVTVDLAEQLKFIRDNTVDDATPSYTLVAGKHVEPGDVTEMYDLRTSVSVGPHGTSWASDANGRPSLMDAYTDGWVARFEEAKDTDNPFRNRKLRKKWHQGYREAAQELAARREAGIS